MLNQVLISKSNNPYFNLALEEYIVRTFDFSTKNTLLIYRNIPSIILGKNQNIFKEVQLDTIKEENFPICRRISGGGTVVHDLGNINFSFFEKHDLKKVNSYYNSTGFMTKCINDLGVLCTMNDRNAIILYNDLKISGSAQFSCSNGILSHFSLLFNSDLDTINKVLAKNKFEIESKASESVRSKIDNLVNHLELSPEEFIHQIISFWGMDEILFVNDSSYHEVQDLMNSKYKTKEYIYDTSGTAILKFEKGSIKLDKNKILGLDFDLKVENYIGKRILYSEIDREDEFWEYLK